MTILRHRAQIHVFNLRKIERRCIKGCKNSDITKETTFGIFLKRKKSNLD